MRTLRWLVPALVLAAVAVPCAAQAQTAQPRIIGGGPASISSYPYQVSLSRNGSFRCGGSIRDATHVITAAHCVTNNAGQVLSGSFTIGYGSEVLAAQQAVGVQRIDVPPQYVGDPSYDAALLTLSSAIDLAGPNAKAIPLVSPAQSKSSGTAVVSGWGDLAEGSNVGSPTLQAVDVPLLPDQPCVDYDYGSLVYVPSRGVCAGGGSMASGNPDTCQGDSGGPLAVDVDAGPGTQYALLGITSFGDGCGRQDTPAVYTYTQGTGIASFLNQTTATAAAMGTGAQTGTGSTPPPTTATRDTTRPTTRLSKVSCTKKRRCSIRIKAADTGGRVAKLAATVSRKVRTCRSRGEFRTCTTRTRKKTLRAKRVSGGFALTATLAKGRYTLKAVATDAAGNRSRPLSKTFTVRG